MDYKSAKMSLQWRKLRDFKNPIKPLAGPLYSKSDIIKNLLLLELNSLQIRKASYLNIFTINILLEILILPVLHKFWAQSASHSTIHIFLLVFLR